jgi:hypothetical protein
VIPGVLLKAGVVALGMQAQMVRAAIEVAKVYERFGVVCVMTSGVEGKHSAKSLHYQGLAADFRTRHVPNDQRAALRQAVSDALGPDFDVILERTHLHVEYDPK